MSGHIVFSGIASIGCIVALSKDKACAVEDSDACQGAVEVCVARAKDVAGRHREGLIQTCLQLGVDVPTDQKKTHAAVCRYVYKE